MINEVIYMLSSQEQEQLLNAAQIAFTKAYAPYSKFRVGAAVLTKMGNIFTGCNVENSSYGLTICAEKVAIATAVSQEGGEQMEIRAIAIVNESQSYCPPCGGCRQVISEFGADALVWFQGQNGLRQMSIQKLLPESFEFPSG